MARKPKITFEEFYLEMHGSRWPVLREALTAEARGIEITTGLLQPYYLDEASKRAAKALEVKPGDRVLDLCAAPGGKSLILALNLGSEGRLTVNDRSSARRKRLRKVLDDHLSEPLLKRIAVTGHDAARWGLHEQNVYDKILLDAPCSSERHLLRSPRHLSIWSPNRTKHLAMQQYAMLASAVMAAKPGGTILYSTCSVSEFENDGVLEKLFARKSDEVEQVSLDIGDGEPTRFGLRLWPDICSGIGPIYIAKVRKRPLQNQQY